MVSVVAYDRDKSERERIRESCWEQVSRYPREDMKFLEYLMISNINGNYFATAEGNIIHNADIMIRTVEEVKASTKNTEAGLIEASSRSRGRYYYKPPITTTNEAGGGQNA